MVLRVMWGVCLAISAMITGVGIELHLDGAGPWASYPLVISGIVALPLASAAIESLGRTMSPE